MTPLLAAVFVLTVHRLTRLIVEDDFPPVRTAREWVLSRWPSSDTGFTADAATGTSGELFELDGLYYPTEPHWAGELISCVWCTSVWVAAVCLPFFWAYPDAMIWVGLIPAGSSIAGIISQRV